MVSRTILAFGFALVALGCTPERGDRASLIAGPTLLAVSSAPAEAAPGAQVTLDALWVDPSGARSASELDWAYCTARRALTDSGTVSPTCLAKASASLIEIGRGAPVSFKLPMDACRLFGPDPPPAVGGEPAGRPVDPDESGGYYQPVRVRPDNAGTAIGSVRVACGASGATPEVATELARRYHANEAPRIERLQLVRADGSSLEVAPDAVGKPQVEAHPSEQVTLRASWSPAESYVVFDPSARAVAVRREALRVAWFATAGQLSDDVTGRAADEADLTDTTDTWTAPDAPGDVRFWLVVRDDRGGVGWQSYRITVAP